MSDMPYHILDGGKVRCHVCGALLRWIDAIETEIGYACEDHILQEDDEPVDAPDPILAWLEREAAEARRVLEAEQDPGNIETMRQWVYHHECMVRKRLDELGLLDVDDEPARDERR